MHRGHDGHDGDPPELAALRRFAETRDFQEFAAFANQVTPDLERLAERRLHDPADAPDVVQQVLVGIWRNVLDGRFPRGNLRAYCKSILSHKLIDHYRRQSRRPRAIGIGGDSSLRAEESSVVDRKQANDASVEESAIYKEELARELARAHSAMEKLTERARILFQAHYLAGKTLRELAESSGLPIPTVKSLVRRSLLRIRVLVSEECPEEHGGDPPAPNA